MSGQFGPTRASDNIRPPVVGDVQVFAVTTANATLEIPTSWRYRYVTFQADAASVYVVFGPTNAVEADPVATSGAKQCVLIPAGAALECYIPGAGDSTVAYLAYIGSGSGTLRCWPSSPVEGGSP